MEIVLKLYTYVDGTNDTPFPNAEEQAMFTFTYDANRMGGSPQISATVKHRLCLDDLWNDKVYATFRGEKYFIMNTPSSDKDNTDERYNHDIQLLSEREVLNHVYFIDAVQGDSTVDVYKSNSTKVIFFGDVNEFVSRLNACLSYQNLDYTAVLDSGVTSEDKQVSFEDKYILEALQEIFNVYEIPYYFVGKVIHVGFTENTITYPLKYGFDEALLSISKQNANYALINKIKGQGSSDNIPYYYPNNSPKGDIGIKIVSGSMIASNFVIFDYVKFSSAMSLTDVCKVRREQGEDGILNYFIWSIDGKDVELSDLGIRLADNVIPMAGSSFMQEKVSYITPMPNLMPSIYRESLGAEQFYEARNNTYEDGEGGYYEFENEYSDTNPRQGTTDFEDIKPTIEGMTNARGQRMDMFSAFAYDTNDNDEVDEEGNYIHSYFFAKLRKFDGENGFNLFDHAIESQPMQISFTSGVCGACTFEIGVGEETQKNIVQVDEFGNLKRDENGNVLWQDQTPQDRQNDTRNYEVWIALKKEDSTYGIVFPNASQNLKPSTSDTFVILGINLPTAYITAAEKRLEQSLIKYMWMNNTEKFTFSIKFSRIFFTEHPEVLEQLNENSRVLIEYNGQQHTLYVDNFSYKTDDSSPLPEIEIDLVDTLSVGQNSLQTQLDSVKQDILSSIGGGGDFLKQGLKYFLRKDVDDVANGKITFNKGLVSDNISSKSFTSGPFGTGYILKRDGSTGKSYMEIDELYVRLKAYFDTLEIKHLSHVGGRIVLSPASMECNRVEILSGESETLFDKAGSQLFDSANDPLNAMLDGGEKVYRCYFNNTDGERDIVNEFAIDDLAQCREFNVKTNISHNVSNQYYWRRVVGIGNNYIDLSIYDCDSGSMIPKAGDTIVTIGNKTDINRQHVVFLSSYDDDAPCFKLYSGINSYSMLNKEVTVISPNADKNVFTGQVVIKPGSTGFGNLTDAPDISVIESEINNAKEDAQAAKDAVTEAKEDVVDLKDYVNGAFSDGIITEAEAKAIATYINTVESTSQSVAKSYSELYNNGYLEGSAKVSLGNAYTSFVSYKDALLNAVKTAIADGKTTTAEKASVDNAFSRYNTAYASLSTAIETANKSIQDKLKGYSDNAQMAADEAKNNAAQAMEDVNEAKNAVSDLNNYVNGAFSDGIISEAEAKAISTYINTITATKKEVDATYEALYNNEYLTGTAKTLLYKEKSSFNIATTNLITAIQSAIADGKTTDSEKTNVDSKFTAFNASYSYLATAIENANKAIQDTIKSEAVAEAKSDLDSQIGEVSLADKNEIAKNMGYASYEEMKYYAERAQTVIKGGHINTELIEASLLITSQIIANAIKTNALNVNDNFIVNTNGSVSANGTITAEEGRRKAIVSNGFIRLMAMAENWLNFSEILRITSNDDYEPEIYMQGHSHGMRYLSVTPNGITFDYVSTSTGKRTSLTIDPIVIGEGMTNAVIKKTSDGMLYVAENEETKYKLTINISGKGTTSPSPGNKYVTGGSTIRIIAYPDEGYEFVRWSDGGAQSHNIVVSYDGYSVTAYFTKKEDTKYTLSLSSSPSYAGSTSGGGSYTAGTKAYVTAAANSGYRFVRWSDGGAQSHYVTMDANKSLTAYFEAYSITGDEIFSGTALTSSSYWKANGNTSVVSVTGGVATLKFTGNTDSGNNITFNKGYLGGKLEQGHKYRLSLSVKASSTTYLVGLIGTDMDISKSISSNGVIYGEEINTSYKSISIEITVDNRDSNVSDALYLVATSDCTLYINSISLKEV